MTRRLDRSRVADVVSQGPGCDQRGSGYLVVDGWILTARHVVAGAAKVSVWLGAPPRLHSDSRLEVDLTSALLDERSDLALLPINAKAQGSVEPALLGRLDREASEPVPVVALGCPRFKLRPSDDPKVLVRELEEVHGRISPRSNLKTRTYEMADLAVVPPEDVEPDKHSPWEGMSGAAVWADERLIGVVGQHHPREGCGTLTIRPLEELLTGSASQTTQWRNVLGPPLPSRPGGLWLVRRTALGEAEIEIARQVAENLAPPELEEREDVLAGLDLLLRSDEGWCWIQGEAFAGKTALLAWLVTHPPPDVALVSCFIRGAENSTASAEYALSRLTAQLAARADRVDHQTPRFLPEMQAQFFKLLPAAARACRERGHRLVMVIDGLDEYDRMGIPLREWLVGEKELPSESTLLVASRLGVDVGLPPRHPLREHVLQLPPTPAADEVRVQSLDELNRALAHRGRLEYAVLGFVATADGRLTPTELQALLNKMSISAFVAEISATLGLSLHRTITSAPDSGTRAGFAFASSALRDAALNLLAEDRAVFESTILAWCNEFRAAAWPEGTPDYVLSHYARKLRAAGQHDALIALLEDHSWFGRQDVFDPSSTTYLSSVEAAWAAAEELNEKQIGAHLSADWLGAEIRACLTVSSLGSLGSRLSPSLITALVDCEYWSVRRAFEVACLVPDARNRVELLMTLATAVPDNDLREQVVRQSMTAIAGIEDEMQRAWHWRKLGPFVPVALLDEALRLGGSLPNRLPDDRRPRALAEAALLARAAAVGQGNTALIAARSIPDEGDRARVLASVAGTLPADRADEALRLVQDLRYEEDRAEPLAALAVAITLTGRMGAEPLLRQAFTAALALSSPQERSRVLRRIAPVLPEEWVREALDEARSGLEKGIRWTLMQALSIRLGVLGQWASALELARELGENDVWRVRALVGIAPYAPDSERPALAEEMLQAALGIEDRILLPYELAKVAPFLTDQLVDRGLKWAQESGKGTIATVRALLPRYAELGHPQEAYDRALATQDEDRNAFFVPGVDAWAALIPHLPQPIRARACDQAIRLASSIADVTERAATRAAYVDETDGELLKSLRAADGSTRSWALRALLPNLPNLPDQILSDMVEVALTVETTVKFAGTVIRSPRADILTVLGPRLQGTLRQRALEAASAAVSKIDDPAEHDKATMRVAAAFSAPDVAPTEVREAVTRRIRQAGHWPWRYELVADVGKFLPPDLIEQVKAERRAADTRSTARVNAILTPDTHGRSLESSILHTALHEAGGIIDPDLRANALDRLAPHLRGFLERGDPHDQTDREWAESLAEVLKLLGPHLTREQLPDAMKAALKLVAGHSVWSLSVLESLAGPLAALPRNQLYPLWRQTLHALGGLHRTGTLRNLRMLAPVVMVLGGRSAARALMRAVEETGDWWP